jgi:RsiW-degrading membrane proteinase PrsW (M82 family)
MKWLWVLIGGIVAFIAANLAWSSTNVPGFLSAALFIGALVVPVTMVTFFYEHIHDRDISAGLLAFSFIFGGAIGLTAAYYLEYYTISHIGVGQLIAVGFIEETAKMIFPVIMYMSWKQRHQADGLNFGVAAGMGFASLETIGYGLSVLAQNSNNISSLNQLLIVRGLLSPAGHAAWTGILSAVLWRERERLGRIAINAPVIAVYLLVVFLHFSWDIFSTMNLPQAVAIIGLLAVAVLSFSLLMLRYRDARRDLKRLALT